MKLLATALWTAAALFASDTGIHIPFEKYKLANGMRVVLARDTSVPVVAVYVLYDVGARSEEEGRIGFAHLFERMMFEGSAHAKKGEHVNDIQANGGEAIGSTHLDYTEFYDTIPSNQLALALWLESDRMASLTITEENLKNLKDVLQKEKAASFDNQPYRPAISEQWPAMIFSDSHNKHSVVGRLDDLNAATVEEAVSFYKTCYAPNNAVLVISGDFEAAEAKNLVNGYFGAIPSQPQPKRPDSKGEAPRTEAKALTVKDLNARVPAVIVGWPAPQRHSPDWYALSMIDAVLTSGDSARLRLNMVKGRMSLLQGDSNLGWPDAGPADFKDPGYYTAILIYKPNFQAKEILDQYQNEIDHIARYGVGHTELERLQAVLSFSKATETQTALSRAKLLGIHELLDGDAGYAEKDFANLMSVTSEQMQAAINKYLTVGRRDVLTIQPVPQSAGGGK